VYLDPCTSRYITISTGLTRLVNILIQRIFNIYCFQHRSDPDRLIEFERGDNYAKTKEKSGLWLENEFWKNRVPDRIKELKRNK